MESLLPTLGLDPWMTMVIVLGWLAYKAWVHFLDDDNEHSGK